MYKDKNWQPAFHDTKIPWQEIFAVKIGLK